MLILNCIPEERGWSPIQHMLALAAELFDASVLNVSDHHPGFVAQAASVLRRRTKSKDRESCLLVGAGPGDLTKILDIPDWRKRFGVTGAWIIDSFWVDHIPKILKLANPFDHIFVTLLEDIEIWRRATGANTVWLPWGSDALRLGSCSAHRAWDITRVGRQPPEWEEDFVSSRDAKSLGINYRCRPASDGMNTLQNQRLMMNVYADTKYVLAFSNAANPEPYTHPTRQYLTGRWVDGLAGGSVLAGVHPQGESASALLWNEATLNFGTVRREEGLQVLAAALREWTPQLAVKNHAMALKTFDWRWRFQTLAGTFGLTFDRLDNEIKLLRERIDCLEVP
jgi:hypothetical protein